MGMTDVGVVGIAIPGVLAAVERIFVRPVGKGGPSWFTAGSTGV